MQCPKCKNNGSRVVDSRPADDGHLLFMKRVRKENTVYNIRALRKGAISVIKRNGNRI